MYRIADLIKDYFVSKGVDTCFCVTGGGAMHFNDSFGHDPRISVIYNHHEQASAVAAEGYARVSGKPAIVSVTSGPGATNAITGVVGAWLDSIPMVVLSGQMKRETLVSSTNLPLRQLGFQEYNIVDVAKHMTKYCRVLSDPDTVIDDLEEAYHIMMSGRKGPIWLDVPLDVQAFESHELKDIASSRQYPDNCSAISDNAVDYQYIIKRLSEAKRPVLMVGYEVRMDNCVADFLELVENIGIPVVTEWNSHDLIPDDNPLNSGRPGTIGDRAGNFVVQQSDILLCIGCQLSIRQISYAWQNFAPRAYKIGASSDLSELHKPTVSFDLALHCSVKTFISGFNSFLRCNSYITTHGDWSAWARNLYIKYSGSNYSCSDDGNGLSVYSFFTSLNDSRSSDSVTVLANGAACVAGLQTLKSIDNQRFFTNAGASGMGYAIAASIGTSAFCGNGTQVICVEGDGSIQMNIQELQTIVHNRLNIKIFWLNNNGYQSIRITQRSMFNAETTGYCGAGPESGISFPSAERIANAYNIPYYKLCSHDDLQELASILKSDGPLIAEVILNPLEEFAPKLQSRLNPDGTFSTPSLEDMAPFLRREEINSTLFQPNDK